jgi:hypothetical protein
MPRQRVEVVAGAIIVGDGVGTDSVGSAGRRKRDTRLDDGVKCVDSLLGGGGESVVLDGNKWLGKKVGTRARLGKGCGHIQTRHNPPTRTHGHGFGSGWDECDRTRTRHTRTRAHRYARAMTVANIAVRLSPVCRKLL